MHIYQIQTFKISSIIFAFIETPCMFYDGFIHYTITKSCKAEIHYVKSHAVSTPVNRTCYREKWGFQGFTLFLSFFYEHRLWVLFRNASVLYDSLDKNLAREPVTEVFLSVRNDNDVKEIDVNPNLNASE